MRVAAGQFGFEGNSLANSVFGEAEFKRGRLAFGDDVAVRIKGTETAIAGGVNTLSQAGADVVFIAAAYGGAGGKVADAFSQGFRAEFMRRLSEAMPLDGVYLAIHGAMIAETDDDPEGQLIADIRDLVGPNTPIAVALDMHGFITPNKRKADIIVGFQRYPHDDAFDTGQKAAGMLLQVIGGKIRPKTHMRTLAAMFPATGQCTIGSGPLADIYRTARAMEASGAALSVSYFPTLSQLDLPDIGFSVLVITDGDEPAAEKLSTSLSEQVWQKRHDFVLELHDPVSAIRVGTQTTGQPVVLIDAADCVGGGAAGDGIEALDALIRANPAGGALAMVVDPQAVDIALKAGVGAEVSLDLGYGLDPSYGQPLAVKARVVSIHDGKFRYGNGPSGNTTSSMGPTAVVAIGTVRVVVASIGTYEVGDEQFRAAGLDPASFKFVVVKNPINFRLAFSNAAAWLFLDTAGPTTPKLADVPWRRKVRPYFPPDDPAEPIFLV